jgi:hypothetical protein
MSDKYNVVELIPNSTSQEANKIDFYLITKDNVSYLANYDNTGVGTTQIVEDTLYIFGNRMTDGKETVDNFIDKIDLKTKVKTNIYSSKDDSTFGRKLL